MYATRSPCCQAATRASFLVVLTRKPCRLLQQQALSQIVQECSSGNIGARKAPLWAALASWLTSLLSFSHHSFCFVHSLLPDVRHNRQMAQPQHSAQGKFRAECDSCGGSLKSQSPDSSASATAWPRTWHSQHRLIHNSSGPRPAILHVAMANSHCRRHVASLGRHDR